jgi:hypothetical protein
MYGNERQAKAALRVELRQRTAAGDLIHDDLDTITIAQAAAYLVADTAAALPATEPMPWDKHNIALQKKHAWPRNTAASGQAEEDVAEDEQEHKQDQQDNVNMAAKPKAPAFALVVRPQPWV